MNIESLLSISQGMAGMAFLAITLILLIFMKFRLRKWVAGILALWFLLIVFDMVINVGYKLTPILNKGIIISNNIIIPLCFLFVADLFKPHSINLKKSIVNISPFILALVAYMFFPTDAVYNVILLLDVAFVIVYLLILLKRIKYYRIRLKNYYSNTDKFSLHWLWGVLIFFGLMTLVWLYFCYVQNEIVGIINCYTTVLFWVVILIFIYKHYIELEMLDTKEEDEVDKNIFPVI